MYKTANGWTKAAMLEHVKKEFKGKSIEASGLNDNDVSACLYRGPNGTKCAIGMFIPDLLARKADYQGSCSINHLYHIMPEFQSFMPLESLEGLAELQSAHDKVDDANCLQSILDFIEQNVE